MYIVKYLTYCTSELAQSIPINVHSEANEIAYQAFVALELVLHNSVEYLSLMYMYSICDVLVV